VPLADHNHIAIGSDLPDERYLFLSDILATAWQGVEYADLSPDGVVAVLGLGPVGQFVARIARHRGHRVLAVDPVPERRAMALRHGIEVFDDGHDTVATLRELTEGRGPDAVIDAVGLEAHGSPTISALQQAVGLLPAPLSRGLLEHAGVDRLAALHTAIELVRRGGTVSLSGVYAGEADILPMKTMFDKQISLRMGQCNVKRWTADLLPLVEDPADPLAVMDLVTHHVPLERAPEMYRTFQRKEDGCVKVVLHPSAI